MMRILFLILAMLATPVLAEEPSPAQQLRKHFVNGCVARAIQRDDDASEATRFCSCAFNVMAAGLSVRDYIEVDKPSEDRRPVASVPAVQR